MDYWSAKGRPMLLAALETVCNTVEKELAADIQQQAERRHASILDEISQLKATAARADQLERENRSLLRELEEFRKKQVSQHPATARSPVRGSVALGEQTLPATRPALAEVSANVNARPVKTRDSAARDPVKPDLEKDYSRLVRVHTALVERYQESKLRATRLREERQSWIEYAQSLEVKIRKLEKKLERNKAHNNELLPSSNTTKPEPARSVSANGISSRAAFETAVLDHGRTPVEEETQDESGQTPELPPVPPSMSTDPVVEIKEEPSSDEPVMISERIIRKRKHPSDDAEIPTPPRRIKSEQSINSDPIITSEVPVFRPHESIDLDEEDQRMPTPRKQRASGHQRLQEEGPIKHEDPFWLHSSEPQSANRAVNAPRGGLDRHSDRPVATSLCPTHRQPGAHKDGRSPIRAGWTLDNGIAEVAEDGSELFEPRGIGENERDHMPAHGRLHSLLHQNVPEKTSPLVPLAGPGRGTRPPRMGHGHIENVTARQTPGQRRNISARASPTVETPHTTSPVRHAREQTDQSKPARLRDRPLAELRPEDFKINPKYNDGYSYAFSEVVRNKGQRAELAGCTDPNCCGRKFRAMAESELNAAGPGILYRVADTKMMEDYLGNEAYRLLCMTREERRRLWIKAKTQDLADRYGRHRDRFARRPSPPGYWNPDFPSTQDIEKSKEEGEIMEKRLVEERWREAMRGGGRWLFRDE
ncbi:DNA repair protein endonuclease SAE2/CtIP C-terminus-domain-containing protein [Chaetomium strumarium]|uniref:DNA repair protein endonuclease SAE2/CtIP C-terminus-domain-containing protein n=1 Tax=Chaetomium strumarium TaxID=1170767 RepID=A0AAJ0M3T0_9PEZI|nr:DNA repair protein endonuclease SAE2/CtIP C-terminus-domain-containing protein [Chaetomium strumarium]